MIWGYLHFRKPPYVSQKLFNLSKPTVLLFPFRVWPVQMLVPLKLPEVKNLWKNYKNMRLCCEWAKSPSKTGEVVWTANWCWIHLPETTSTLLPFGGAKTLLAMKNVFCLGMVMMALVFITSLMFLPWPIRFFDMAVESVETNMWTVIILYI